MPGHLANAIGIAMTATAMPYRPARPPPAAVKDTRMPAAMTTTGSAVDCIEIARPSMMLVA
jgi:hypothetical protein